MYGHRRLGKSTLIKRVLTDSDVYFLADRSFIELGRRLPIEQALAAHFSEYVSMHWEKICRDAVTGNMVENICTCGLNTVMPSSGYSRAIFHQRS